MVARTILTIASDDTLLQIIRWQLQDHEANASRMTVASSIDEACPLVQALRPRLIVIHWSRGMRYDEMNRLLWTATVSAQVPSPCWSSPTGIASNRRQDSFEMGVADYISRSHHESHFGRVLDVYIRARLLHQSRMSGAAGRHGQASRSPTSSCRAVRLRVG